MKQLRDALAYCLALLRGRGDDAGHDEGAGPHDEDAPSGTGDVRSAEQRKHFWAEFHEGQRQAEERARPPR
jgi:hypothetical protein